VDGFLECARRTYGDLRRPDHTLLSTLLQDDVYSNLRSRLRTLGPIEDVTEANYDLCNTWRAANLDLLISLVGPYVAVVAHTGLVIEDLANPWASTATASGLRLVTAEELMSEVPFMNIDTGTYGCPLYKMLFTLSDRNFRSR
jgi:hydrogenase maturation factor